MCIRIGINPLTWTNDDLPSLGAENSLEMVLSEGKKAGYTGFELGNKFPREPGALRQALEPYGLALVSGWYSSRLLARDVKEEFAAIQDHLHLLQALGAKVMVFAEVTDYIHGDRDAPVSHRPRMTDAQWKAFGQRLTEVAEHIYLTSTEHGKRCQALGGAKNHMVVMPDADLDQVVDALMGAAYGLAGERCMAICVAVAVGDEVGDELVRRLTPRVVSLKVLASDNPDAEMGPLVTREHREKVKGYVDLGVEEGASLVVDGRDYSVAGCEQGFFLSGCLFDHVSPQMRIYKEEIFGPVLCVVRVLDF
jgi:hypothetical protein